MSRTFNQILSSRLFDRPESEQGTFQAVKWWERRRPTYNLIVGAVGVVSVLLMSLIYSFWPASDPNPPMQSVPLLLPLFAVIFYGLGANLCYTGGWICEVVIARVWGVRSPHYSRIALPLGLAFSVLLTLAPVGSLALLFLVRSVQH